MNMNMNNGSGEQRREWIETKSGVVLRKMDMLKLIILQWRTIKNINGAQRQYRKLRRQKIKEMCNEALVNLQNAKKKNDAGEMWKIMRTLGGKNRGPKKRKFNVPMVENPTIEEWIEHLKQPGKEGGCEAEIVEIVNEGEEFSKE